MLPWELICSMRTDRQTYMTELKSLFAIFRTRLVVDIYIYVCMYISVFISHCVGQCAPSRMRGVLAELCWLACRLNTLACSWRSECLDSNASVYEIWDFHGGEDSRSILSYHSVLPGRKITTIWRNITAWTCCKDGDVMFLKNVINCDPAANYPVIVSMDVPVPSFVWRDRE